jgi:hypothetical protein
MAQMPVSKGAALHTRLSDDVTDAAHAAAVLEAVHALAPELAVLTLRDIQVRFCRCRFCPYRRVKIQGRAEG